MDTSSPRSHCFSSLDTAAIQNLREAQRNLESASHDKGGRRATALQLVNQAIAEVEVGMR